MNNLKYSWKIYFFILIFFACLFCVGLRFDLDISQAICNEDSIFAMIVSTFSCLGQCTVVTLCGVALIKYNIKAEIEKFKKIFYLLIGFLFLSGSTFLLSFHLFIYRFDGIREYISVVGRIILFVLLQSSLIVGSCFFIKTTREKANRLAIFVFVTLAITELLINFVFKKAWLRPRFWMLNDSPELLSYYRTVLEPAFIYGKTYEIDVFIPYFEETSDYFYSFLSGHSAEAASAIIFGYLVLLNDKLRKPKNMLIGFIAGFIFLLVVMCSRIVYGAHFLTDVCAGASLLVILMWIFDFSIYRNDKLWNKNKSIK